MATDLRQRLATSALLVTAEKICAAGWLPEGEEMHLRRMIAEVRSAFADQIPERRFCAGHDFDPDYTRTIEAVAREMMTT